MAFDPQPVLKGELVELRPLRDEDFDDLYALVFRVGPRNLRSQRALEKIGAVRSGSGVDAAGRDSYLVSDRGLGLRATAEEFARLSSLRGSAAPRESVVDYHRGGEMPSSNMAVVRGIYEALARGDVPALLGALDPQIEWREAEGFPYGGTYHGPDEVLQEVFSKLGGEWDGFQAVPETFVDGGSTIVALGTYSGTYEQTGKRFRAPFAHVWWLEDGKPVRFQQFTDTALAQEAVT